VENIPLLQLKLKSNIKLLKLTVQINFGLFSSKKKLDEKGE